MDFPKYDDKYDPLVFINHCESYFSSAVYHGEGVDARYNLEVGAQMWYIYGRGHTAMTLLHRVAASLVWATPLRSNPPLASLYGLQVHELLHQLS
jgi:hypothetical protein